MNHPNPSYDADARLAEFYDLTENYSTDVELLRRLLTAMGQLRIFEPFCGTGRIAIPLAEDGHDVLGMDLSQPMQDRARAKMAALGPSLQRRVRLIRGDCLSERWPGGFDVVVLGGNCFYELATVDEQEACVRLAAGALKTGGHVFLDNNHMEGELDERWAAKRTGPTGTLPDGTTIEGTSEVIWMDRAQRLCRSKRQLTIRFPDGREISREWVQQKHPPSIAEMCAWLHKYGFCIEASFGDREGATLTESSPRAIFWCRKEQ